MNTELITSITDDFNEQSGPITVTHAFLSIDGMLFEIGRFYEGPHMNKDTGKRLKKVLEFGEFLKGCQK